MKSSKYYTIFVRLRIRFNSELAESPLLHGACVCYFFKSENLSCN